MWRVWKLLLGWEYARVWHYLGREDEAVYRVVYENGHRYYRFTPAILIGLLDIGNTGLYGRWEPA